LPRFELIVVVLRGLGDLGGKAFPCLCDLRVLGGKALDHPLTTDLSP